MSIASRTAELRKAASLKNYKVACASQWDDEVEVEDNEIPVIDLITAGPIEIDDLVILSDGKCYSKSFTKEAFEKVAKMRLPATQQLFRLADLLALGFQGKELEKAAKKIQFSANDQSMLNIKVRNPKLEAYRAKAEGWFRNPVPIDDEDLQQSVSIYIFTLPDWKRWFVLFCKLQFSRVKNENDWWTYISQWANIVYTKYPSQTVEILLSFLRKMNVNQKFKTETIWRTYWEFLINQLGENLEECNTDEIVKTIRLWPFAESQRVTTEQFLEAFEHFDHYVCSREQHEIINPLLFDAVGRGAPAPEAVFPALNYIWSRSGFTNPNAPLFGPAK